MSADSIVGDGLAQSPYEELRAERDALLLGQADIAKEAQRMLDRLRAERDEARARAEELEALTVNPDLATAWQRLGQRAERAESDLAAARALLREARDYVMGIKLRDRIDAALKDSP